MATSKKIVKAIKERSKGICERSGCFHFGNDPHHLIEGTNKKATESVENVLWVCRSCHNYLHLDEKGIKENRELKIGYQARMLRLYGENEARDRMGGKLLLDEDGNIPTDRECHWLKEGL